jgi:hypothetical protein
MEEVEVTEFYVIGMTLSEAARNLPAGISIVAIRRGQHNLVPAARRSVDAIATSKAKKAANSQAGPMPSATELANDCSRPPFSTRLTPIVIPIQATTAPRAHGKVICNRFICLPVSKEFPPSAADYGEDQ